MAAIAASLPAIVGALPAPGPGVDPASLAELVLGSGEVAFEGYAESHAGLDVPEVPRAGRLVNLFAETTRMRAWFRSSAFWRVDELSPIGERAVYRDASGLMLWDSGSREAVRVLGEPSVRLPRPSDLLPSELGRRLVGAADPSEVTALAGRRIAGIDAAGLRIVPASQRTTVAEVRLWADPASGLPLRVELTPRGAEAPLITTYFLEVEIGEPERDLVTFEIPRDAGFSTRSALDLAHEIELSSVFVLPDRLAGLARRNEVAGAGATYGRGFDLVAVLALPPHLAPTQTEALRALPVETGPWGRAQAVRTPLLNGLMFTKDEVSYIVTGTVSPEVVAGVAARLAREGVGVR